MWLRYKGEIVNTDKVDMIKVTSKSVAFFNGTHAVTAWQFETVEERKEVTDNIQRHSRMKIFNVKDDARTTETI